MITVGDKARNLARLVNSKSRELNLLTITEFLDTFNNECKVLAEYNNEYKGIEIKYTYDKMYGVQIRARDDRYVMLKISPLYGCHFTWEIPGRNCRHEEIKGEAKFVEIDKAIDFLHDFLLQYYLIYPLLEINCH